jgi:hypothetical protein
MRNEFSVPVLKSGPTIDGVLPMGTGKKHVMWTDGVHYWSYNTCVATPNPDGNGLIVNVTPYSKTTVEKRRELVRAWNDAGIDTVEVADLGFEVTPDDLIARSRGDESERGIWYEKPTRYTGGGFELKERKRSTLI